MVFCSVVFLFLFLPLVLAVNFVLPRLLRNSWLLLVSLLFYAWGEKIYTLVMLGSILFNYVLVLLAERMRQRGRQRRFIIVAIVFNLGALVAFKYANFLVDNLNVVFHWLNWAPIILKPVHLPIGISFFTFHALSYVVDVYRGRTPAQKNPIDFGLYITLFPQLVAGPIVRYTDIARQFATRLVNSATFAYGVRRFIFGLAKKMLIANTLAVAADKVFGVTGPGGSPALPLASLTVVGAWLGAICYMMQIYFDFSGYSDMAIGLAAMLGFSFKENFEHPYVSKSITEFWRRWHISLSTWFRDYLYIPLGGNRVGPTRLALNLLTVFVLCGLWHGASWTFLLWGLYHGFFLVLERAGLGWLLDRLWAPLRHAYTLVVVLCGWVLFRANTLAEAVTVFKGMLGRGRCPNPTYLLNYLLQPDIQVALIAAVICCCPVLKVIHYWQRRLLFTLRHTRLSWGMVRSVFTLADVATVGVLMIGSFAVVAATTYNPFIYFRF